jgi:hypothetical protein
MLNIEEARTRVAALPRVAKVRACIEYGGVYLARVEYFDEGEGNYDPFFSVDKETGATNEFSFIHDGNPFEIMMLFLAAEEDDV